MNETVLTKRIEKLKKRLTDVYLEKGSLIDPNVITVSQEIDHLVLLVQKKQLASRAIRFMMV